MKRKLIFFGLLVAASIGAFLFFQKHYLTFELAGEIKNAEEEFCPDAYSFFHSDKELQTYFNLNKNTKRYGVVAKDINFDFDKYSYVVVYGRKIKSIHYSHKESMFDDISPAYARPSSRTVVFINYQDASDGEGIYFYSLPKDKRLRGFFGI